MADRVPRTRAHTRRRDLSGLALLVVGAFGVAALGHVLYHGLRKPDLRGQRRRKGKTRENDDM